MNDVPVLNLASEPELPEVGGKVDIEIEPLFGQWRTRTALLGRTYAFHRKRKAIVKVRATWLGTVSNGKELAAAMRQIAAIDRAQNGRVSDEQ